jgi:hypothetical protein
LSVALLEDLEEKVRNGSSRTEDAVEGRLDFVESLALREEWGGWVSTGGSIDLEDREEEGGGKEETSLGVGSAKTGFLARCLSLPASIFSCISSSW